MVVLKVAGGQAVRAGLPVSYRVVASWADRRKSTDVQVTDVRLDGTSVLKEPVTGTPSVVTLDIPTTVGDEIALAFELNAAGRTETLHLTAPVRRMTPEPALPDSPPTLSETKLSHRVSLLPEAGVLTSGLVNRVFVRVRDLAGSPLANASVRVTHKSLPDGSIQKPTDGSGLIAFDVDARQPSFRFGLTVTHEGVTTEMEELLVPLGRQMLLRALTPVSQPEQPIEVRLTTWQADAEVFCDLIQGDVHLWSERVTTAGGHATLRLGPWPEGRYSVQCSDHPWALGQAFATTPLLVSEEQPLDALLTELRDQQTLHPSGLVEPAGTDAALAAAYWRAILRDDPVDQTILLSTREADLTARSDTHEELKFQLLLAIALVFLLVLAWMAETIIKNTVATRDRLRAYAAESFMDNAPVEVDGLVPGDMTDRQTLIKVRSILGTVVFLGAIIANIVGLIWLFALIR